MLVIYFQLQTYMLHVTSACINKNPHKTIKIRQDEEHIENIHM